MQTQHNDNCSSGTAVSSMNETEIKQNDNCGVRLIQFSLNPRSDVGSNFDGVVHRYVPSPDIESEEIFGISSIGFNVVCLLLQYLLIYKSEKWLGPYLSENDSFVHWQHIDFYLLIILLLMCISFERRLTLLRTFINVVALIYSTWSHSWKYLLIFTYPLFCATLVSRRFYKNGKKVFVSTVNLPGHWCSGNAVDLRNETDCLRWIFNQRIGVILLSSFLSLYYTFIAPLGFCDTHYIHLDLNVLIPFGLVIFFSFLMLNVAHYLPLELLTVFHRNGQHLGSWSCLKTSISSSIVNWDEKSIQPYDINSLVRHKRQIYRSSNRCSTVAEPGNVSHSRFGLLFGNPLVFPLILFLIQIFLLLMQIGHLLIDRRWFVDLSQMIVFLFNTYSLRHNLRDIYLLYLVYH